MPKYRRFIPVRQTELVRDLKSDFGYAGERGQCFDMLVSLLHQLFRYTYDDLFEGIKECYYPLNPDAETVTRETFDDAELARRRAKLIELLVRLMDVANCEPMSSEELKRHLAVGSVFGLEVQVDTSRYDELRVFYRGEVVRDFEKRTLRRLFRREVVSVDCFQRLILVVQPKGDRHVYLKMFKDVPANSLEMLLPGIEIRMTLFDKMKLGGSGLFGLIVPTLRWSLRAFEWVGSLMLASVVAVVAAAAYAVKTILGFRRLKNVYLGNLLRRLYFNNLDNNLGVIRSLVDMAVAEELAEALIAWCILDREKKLIPAEEVKHRAEEYLKRTYGIEVEYEIGDALRKLEDRGLLINHHPGLNVLGLERSLKTLDKGWDGVFVP